MLLLPEFATVLFRESRSFVQRFYSPHSFTVLFVQCSIAMDRMENDMLIEESSLDRGIDYPSCLVLVFHSMHYCIIIIQREKIVNVSWESKYYM